MHFQRKFIPQSLQGKSGLVLTFKSNNPAYSYVKTDKSGIATLTAEKEVISNNACVGVYGFASGKLFVEYAQKMIAMNLRTRNEFYITPLYNLMIQDNHQIGIQEVERMYIMGTPEEYKFFTTRVLNPLADKPIALVCDHSGYELKEQAKNVIISHGLKYIDLGCYTNKDCDQFDYVSQAIAFIKNGTCGYALGFCCTGQAVNIAANKTDGIRAALIYDAYSAEYAIKHNCSNFFSIPSRTTTVSDLSQYISLWLETDFEGGRHCARIQKIENSYGRL